MRKLIAVGLLGMSCGGEKPAAPIPEPIDGVTISHAAGSRFTVGTCLSPGGVALCTRELTGSFAVTVNEDMPGATMYVEFMSAGRACAVAESSPASLLTNRTVTMSYSAVYVWNPPSVQCPMPFTTSTAVATLRRQGGAARNRINFDAAYTFSEAATPTPGPPNQTTPSPTSAPPQSSDGFPVCAGGRPSAPCGLASGRCVNGEFTCSQNRSGTCSGNGGLQCVYCPGPIC